jgi:hypothetical protein
MPTKLELIGSLLRAANNVVDRFRQNPYAYLFESDLQADLFAELRREIVTTVPVPLKPVAGAGSARTANVHLVCSEYFSRFDVAILDPEKLVVLSGEDIREDSYRLYNLRVWAAVELKYRKAGDRFGVITSIADLDKLQRQLSGDASCNGLALAFLQQSESLNDFLGSGRFAQPVDSITKLNSVYVVTPDSLRLLV